MPELPDVEGFRRYFKRHAAGARVESAAVLDRELLRNATPQRLGRALSGKRLEEPHRHGKWLFAPAGGAVLLFHFGMTGLLRFSSAREAPHPHDRLVLHLDRGDLAYRNMRRFGGVWLARDERERERVTGPLGPDAAGPSEGELAELVRHRRGGLKAALLDQTLLAGVGNLLADETLWRAGLHPSTGCRQLDERATARLHEALDWTIRESSKHGRIPRKEGWLTAVRDERDPACPRCGTVLRAETIAGRPTRSCPRCQPAP